MKKRILSFITVLTICSGFSASITAMAEKDNVTDNVSVKEEKTDVSIFTNITDETEKRQETIQAEEGAESDIDNNFSTAEIEKTKNINGDILPLSETGSGTCGDNLTWTLDIYGTLTISGTGDMDDYTTNYVPWYEYAKYITNVDIKSGVTSISVHAFYGYDRLTSVTIGESVTSIGDYAFVDCSKLTSVTIPNSLTSIGRAAFWKCESLTSVYVTDLESYLNIDFKSDESNPMYYAYKLYINNRRIAGKVTIPDGVTKIPDYAFKGCDGITSVTIPDGVTSIGDYAFNMCSNLTSVTIPDGVTSIGMYAFNDCNKLTSVTIPYGVTSIGMYAFNDCSGLTSVTIPDSVTSIESYAFSDCSKLISVTIPDRVTSIGSHMFYRCTSLTSVNMGNGVTSIGDYAFYSCTSLVNLNMGEGVTSIGFSAFKECESLTSLIIPDRVTNIESSAFYSCSSLKTLYYNAKKCANMGSDVFSLTALEEIYIGNDVEIILPDAFSHSDKLSKVAIPKSVTEIEVNAFSRCSNLNTVEYGGSEEDWNQTYIGSGNDFLKNAVIHFNSPIYEQGEIELKTPAITKSETENEWIFTVDVEQPYIDCSVYVGLYDDNGELLETMKVPLNMSESTKVIMDKKENTAKAKVYVWNSYMKPVTHIGEIPLI